MNVQNIFEKIPGELKEEYFEEIISNNNFRLERIVSDGHISPEGFWYDQNKNEFVILISGSAVIELENDVTMNMKPGDYLIIPANKKHRVVKTDENEKTYWLVLHY